jgi:GTP-binding protein
LKHIERTRLIAHLVDTSDANDRDPIRDFGIIEHELASFSPALTEKPMIVVATKLDATTNRGHLDELRAFAKKRGLEFHAVSSASGEGIVGLVRAMADALDRIPRPSIPAELEVQPGPSRERDAEEARAAAASDDGDSTLPPQEKR